MLGDVPECTVKYTPIRLVNNFYSRQYSVNSLKMFFFFFCMGANKIGNIGPNTCSHDDFPVGGALNRLAVSPIAG